VSVSRKTGRTTRGAGSSPNLSERRASSARAYGTAGPGSHVPERKNRPPRDPRAKGVEPGPLFGTRADYETPDCRRRNRFLSTTSPQPAHPRLPSAPTVLFRSGPENVIP